MSVAAFLDANVLYPATIRSVLVHHPIFGDGKVEGFEDNKLTIAFEGQVTKVIREDFITRKR